MYKIKNLIENENVKVLEELGAFTVIEHEKDLSTSISEAQKEYYSSKMNLRRKQLICNLKEDDVVLQEGAMQWMVGDVSVNTGVKGVGDFFGKLAKSKVTKESVIKPQYFGTGEVILEPTYKHILLIDVSEWQSGIVIEDGMYLASEASLTQSVVMRNTISSAALGGEGLFNLSMVGNGVVALESYVPRQELIEIELDNDVIKVDGNMAIAWSNTLKFTVEKATKNLMGSMASGEGFVNVYRGTGRILLAPY